MIERASKKRFHRTFKCDACGVEIALAREAVVVREACALPEEFELFQMHPHCAEQFVSRQSGRWEIYPLASMEAQWLLPMVPLERLDEDEPVTAKPAAHLFA
jgi:hypothetical protein